MYPTSPREEPTVPGHHTTAPHPPAGKGRGTAQDNATDVVRWAAFSCVLVPVVLVGYGTSLAGTAGTALGLAAVTGACRVLLRRSERGAAELHAAERTPHHVRHGGADDGDRHDIRQGVRQGAPHGDRHGGRHAGGNTPVD
ncbi:hypothetical protein ACFW9L_24430 [Streptomyces sp. NPDC059517]|uniref:hypothetical protein n=1 Tax=Streptomyces sp. NPDC059517 TaxID=3346855 RepID=UPI0036B4DFB0